MRNLEIYVGLIQLILLVERVHLIFLIYILLNFSNCVVYVLMKYDDYK